MTLSLIRDPQQQGTGLLTLKSGDPNVVAGRLADLTRTARIVSGGRSPKIPSIYLDPLPVADPCIGIILQEHSNGLDRTVIAGRTFGFVEAMVAAICQQMGARCDRLPPRDWPWVPTWESQILAELAYRDRADPPPRKEDAVAWLKHRFLACPLPDESSSDKRRRVGELLDSLGIEAKPDSLRSIRTPKTIPGAVARLNLIADALIDPTYPVVYPIECDTQRLVYFT